MFLFSHSKTCDVLCVREKNSIQVVHCSVIYTLRHIKIQFQYWILSLEPLMSVVIRVCVIRNVVILLTLERYKYGRNKTFPSLVLWEISTFIVTGCSVIFEKKIYRSKYWRNKRLLPSHSISYPFTHIFTALGYRSSERICLPVDPF